MRKQNAENDEKKKSHRAQSSRVDCRRQCLQRSVAGQFRRADCLVINSRPKNSTDGYIDLHAQCSCFPFPVGVDMADSDLLARPDKAPKDNDPSTWRFTDFFSPENDPRTFQPKGMPQTTRGPLPGLLFEQKIPSSGVTAPKPENDLEQYYSERSPSEPVKAALSNADFEAFLSINFPFKRTWGRDELQDVIIDPKATNGARATAKYILDNFDSVRQVMSAGGDRVHIRDIELLKSVMQANRDYKEIEANKQSLLQDFSKLDQNGSGRLERWEVGRPWGSRTDDRSPAVKALYERYFELEGTIRDGNELSKEDLQSFEARRAYDSFMRDQHEYADSESRTSWTYYATWLVGAGVTAWLGPRSRSLIFAIPFLANTVEGIARNTVKDKVERQYESQAKPSIDKLLGYTN